MRSGWLGGLSAVGGMLLLVAAAMIAQPNMRVLDGVTTVWSDLWSDDTNDVALTVVVDELVVDGGRVRGRVRNTAGVTLSEVLVRVRVASSSGARVETAKVYGLAPGADAWFGLPLLAVDSDARVELVETVARSAGGEEQGAPSTRTLPSPSRRSGVGGAQDVQRFERDMEQMNEAVRSVSPGQ